MKGAPDEPKPPMGRSCPSAPVRAETALIAVLALTAIALAGTLLLRGQAPPDLRRGGAPPEGGTRAVGPRRIDINSATAEQLALLPGIGRTLSERIVARREQKGPFRSVEELTEVSGIGERLLERIRPYVVAREPEVRGPDVRGDPSGSREE